MRTLIATFFAITAINGAPGLSAGVATYFTVLAAVAAAGLYFVSRLRRGRRSARRDQSTPAPVTVVQHIYTTAPVIMAMPGLPAQPATAPGAVYTPADASGQVYLPGSMYQPRAAF